MFTEPNINQFLCFGFDQFYDFIAYIMMNNLIIYLTIIKYLFLSSLFIIFNHLLTTISNFFFNQLMNNNKILRLGNYLCFYNKEKIKTKIVVLYLYIVA